METIQFAYNYLEDCTNYKSCGQISIEYPNQCAWMVGSIKLYNDTYKHEILKIIAMQSPISVTSKDKTLVLSILQEENKVKLKTYKIVKTADHTENFHTELEELKSESVDLAEVESKTDYSNKRLLFIYENDKYNKLKNNPSIIRVKHILKSNDKIEIYGYDYNNKKHNTLTISDLSKWHYVYSCGDETDAIKQITYRPNKIDTLSDVIKNILNGEFFARAGGKSNKIKLLGRHRKVTKRGRTSYITFKGETYSLTEARKLERKLNKA